MKRIVKIGKVLMGGDHPIVIQSMTNTKTQDIEATIEQIKALEALGCEIVRVAVPDMESAKAIGAIKKGIKIPLVADIHFDYRLALEAIHQGVDKVRINPGNIGSIDRVKAVVDAAKVKGIPIRIGVNGGSLEKSIYEKHGGVTAQALVDSAMYHVGILESLDFYDTVISIKSSDVRMTAEAYRLLHAKTDYPLHLGVTEAGTVFSGTIKSAIGIGIPLFEGIGNTIRVSLTGSPEAEIPVAKKILEVLELRHFGVKVISCPTCGRTEVDLVDIANKIETAVAHIPKNITVAVMGCVVNGPGEAKEADLGIAGGKGEFLLFEKGMVSKKVKESEVIEAVLEAIEKL